MLCLIFVLGWRGARIELGSKMRCDGLRQVRWHGLANHIHANPHAGFLEVMGRVLDRSYFHRQPSPFTTGCLSRRSPNSVESDSRQGISP